MNFTVWCSNDTTHSNKWCVDGSQEMSEAELVAVADALGIAPAFEKLMEHPDRRLVSYEPMLQFALDDERQLLLNKITNTVFALKFTWHGLV